jgi:hypothetical protein
MEKFQGVKNFESDLQPSEPFITNRVFDKDRDVVYNGVILNHKMKTTHFKVQIVTAKV